MGNRKPPPIIVALVAFFVIFTVLSVIGFSIPWRSEVASEEGRGIDAVITYLLFATGALVIVGHVILIRFLLKGRDDQKTAYTPPPARVEWMWGVIPVIIMMLLAEAGVLLVGSSTWNKLYAETPSDPVILEIAGKQFEWLIRYPGKDGKFGAYDFKWVNGGDNPMGLDEDDEAALDDVVSRGTIYLPRGRTAQIRLRTHDVIHSFFVPDFRVKQDLIPGFPTEIRFTPTVNGVYELVCTELCGLGHYKMRGQVHVVEPAEYEAWLRERPKFGGED